MARAKKTPSPGHARKTQAMLRGVIDFLPDATFVVNADGEVIIWNRAMEALTGISSDNMLERGNYEYSLPFYGQRRPVLIDLITEPDETIEKLYPGFARDGDRIASETFVPGTVKQGARLWAIAQPLYDDRGDIVGAIESMRDITETREAQEKYATAFKLSPFVLSISSVSDGRYIEVSDRFFALTGYTRDEVIGPTSATATESWQPCATPAM
jgi:PAS domain S-box-containing protein